MTGAAKPVAKNARGLLGPPNAKGNFHTTYKVHYVPPPLGRYTGVSANLGLKARVEGLGAKDGDFGLGPDGQTFYQRTYKPHGDAYKHRQPPEDRAKITHIQPKKDAKVDYTTSYSVWGFDKDLPEGARPQTVKPVYANVSTDYGLGQNDTMYTETYKVPQQDEAFAETVRVTREAVQGHPRGNVEPYGPLCKSLAHESYQAPPKEAYLRLKTAQPKMRNTIPVGTLKPADPGRYGLGEEGKSCYQRTYLEHPLGNPSMRPATTAAKIRQGSLRFGKHLNARTAYHDSYLPPPADLYTGVSANLGLKARVEGQQPRGIEGLGLGPDGQTFYQRTFRPHGDAYKNKQPPEDRAKITHIQPNKDAKVDYTTSYSVWGQDKDLPEGARPQTVKPVYANVSTDYGLGQNDTMYTETYKVPQQDEAFAETVRVTREAVQGHPRGNVEPYGPLCKSLAHESFQAPPKTAYLRSRGEKASDRVHPVGTLPVPPDRQYGLGHYGTTTYHDEFTDKSHLDVTLHPEITDKE
mmetsp:Transcript_67316/g.140236  ORF Transcript_67316/g.140236 Transcript_67316/m.140236 type:complete len:522 (-) Transcript_67316:252-1817(-)